MSSHFASAAASETRAFRKSAGTVCTTPWEIGFIFRDFGLHPIVVAVVYMVGDSEIEIPELVLSEQPVIRSVLLSVVLKVLPMWLGLGHAS